MESRTWVINGHLSGAAESRSSGRLVAIILEGDRVPGSRPPASPAGPCLVPFWGAGPHRAPIKYRWWRTRPHLSSFRHASPQRTHPQRRASHLLAWPGVEGSAASRRSRSLMISDPLRIHPPARPGALLTAPRMKAMKSLEPGSTGEGQCCDAIAYPCTWHVLPGIQ